MKMSSNIYENYEYSEKLVLCTAARMPLVYEHNELVQETLMELASRQINEAVKAVEDAGVQA